MEDPCAASGTLVTETRRRCHRRIPTVKTGWTAAWAKSRGPAVTGDRPAPLLDAPTLMINGRYDGLFQYHVSQKPMFDLLGTPTPHKRHDRLEGSHLPSDRQEMHKAALDWLDHYLGPVRKP